MTNDPRESRPAQGSIFGKRNKKISTSLDPETVEILEAKARLLGYSTFSEFVADVLTINARGVSMLTTLHAERLKAAATIGAELPPLSEGSD
jgi:hypothetical protein